VSKLAGLGEKVPQTATDIKLNPSIRFKGDLLRANTSIDKHGFRVMSYSPDTTLMADLLVRGCYGRILFRTTEVSKRWTPGQYLA
jgi:hypothetical protein